MAMTDNVWKPIGTAPRDNARLLYFARFGKDGKLYELDFDGIWAGENESWEIPHYFWGSYNGIENPTHWAYQDEPIPMIKETV